MQLEYLECAECHAQYDSYHQLHHPTASSGGFCHCGSDNVRSYQKYTVYQTVWAMSEGDAEEVAFDMDEWKTAKGPF